jgi:hypothetical protein
MEVDLVPTTQYLFEPLHPPKVWLSVERNVALDSETETVSTIDRKVRVHRLVAIQLSMYQIGLHYQTHQLEQYQLTHMALGYYICNCAAEWK